MSELLPIWNSSQLTGGTVPPSFTIPNSSNCSIKINNQSRYWLKIYKSATSTVVDRMEPYSYIIMPSQTDISVEVDESQPTSSLNPDTQLVDYSTMSGSVQYSKGSTIFNGTTSVTINGGVSISNSSLAVQIVGTPTFNLAQGTEVTIANSSLNVAITGTPTFNLGAGNTINVGNKVDVTGSTITANIAANQSITVANSSLNVAITGTPSFTVANSSLAVDIQGTPTFNLAAGSKIDASGSTITATISGTPTVNIGAGNQIAVINSVNSTGGTVPMTINGSVSANITNSTLDVSGSTITATISGTPNVNITNSSLSVAISGTPTFNIGTGNSVTVSSGSVTATISGTPNVNISNASLNVSGSVTATISGTPTINIAANQKVLIGNELDANNSVVPVTVGGSVSANITNSSLSVAITGTPTFNIGSGNAVTISSGTVTASISGTPTINIAANQKVLIGNETDVNNAVIPVTVGGSVSANITNSTLNVSGSVTATISGTPNVNITNSSLSVAISGTPTFNIGTGNAVTISSGSVTATISGTPSVNVTNSTLNVAVTGTPTFNIGSGNAVTISGTPTMNLAAGTTVEVSTGSVSINGTANTQIMNDQVNVTQIYNGHFTVTVPSGSTSINVDIPVLPAGQLINIHKGVFDHVSSLGIRYNATNVVPKMEFSDNHTVTVPNASWTPTDETTTTSSFYGNSYACSILTLTLQPTTTPTSNDTVTIYWEVDGNETALDLPDGIVVKGHNNSLMDASGTITTANTSQQALAGSNVSTEERQYLFIQNLSTYDMYVNFGSAATTGAGSILIPPNGGSLSFEGTFIPSDAVNILCGTAGAAYTVKHTTVGI